MSNEPNGNQNTSVSEENKIKAEEIKEAANKLFLAKKYEAAIEKYSEAINLNPNVAAYYANRSFAYFKTEAFGYAITDADKAIKLDPSYTKGYYRRAAANMNLCKFKDALRDFRIVMKRSPDDKDAKAKFTECEKIVKKDGIRKSN